MDGKPSNNKNLTDIVKICVVTVIALAIIGALAWLLSTIFSKSNKENGNDIKNEVEQNKAIENSEVENTNIGDNNYYNNDNYNTIGNNNYGNGTSGTTKPTSTQTVKKGGFELYIPNNLIYDSGYLDNVMTLGDANQTWIAEMQIDTTTTYQQVKQNKDALKQTLLEDAMSVNMTASVSDARVENINGVEYIIFEVLLDGQNMTVACTDLNSMCIVTFIIFNEEKSYKETIEELNPIVTTAKYTGGSSNLKSNNEINLKNLKKTLSEALKAKK